MANDELKEKLLTAWIGANALIKNSRMTQGLTYNEAITMKLAFDQYKSDGIGQISVQHILRHTGMLKSQVNRTINSLCTQGYMTKEKASGDRRTLFVKLVPARIPDFVSIHDRSLQIVHDIIQVIGEADAECFVRIYEKLYSAYMRDSGMENTSCR